MRRIYDGDLFKIYFTQIVKTRDLYMGATYNWMRPIYAKIRYIFIFAWTALNMEFILDLCNASKWCAVESFEANIVLFSSSFMMGLCGGPVVSMLDCQP